MMNLISLAIAIILFVIGFMIHNTWTSFFYSFALIVVAAVASYNWVPLVEYVGPCRPANNSTFWKLVLTIILQLVAIYYASREYPILGAIALVFFVWGWLYVEPISHDGDAAGNGMAAGFSSVVNVGIALFVSILFYAIVKLAHRHEVLIACTILLAFFFMFNALGNYYSRKSGKDAEYTARLWNNCSLQEYIIKTYRLHMLEPNDLWMLNDVGLDYVNDKEPSQEEKEIRYEITIQSHPLPVMVLDAQCKTDTDSLKIKKRERYITRNGWEYPCFESKDSWGDNHTFISKDGSIGVNIVWADPLDRIVYTFSDTLSKEDLIRYKSDYCYNLHYCIASEGKVFLYISDYDKNKYTFVGYVGTGKKSGKYDERLMSACNVKDMNAAFDKVGDHIEKYDRWSWHDDFSLSKLEKIVRLPDRFKDRVSDTFNYQVKFDVVEGEYTMEKMGLLYLDKDKCIEKEMDLQKRPRVKDFFSIWKVGGQTYTAFLFFDVEEMVRVFDEAYGEDPMQEGCLKIKLGKKQKKNEITLMVSGKTYPIENVEMKVYCLESDELDLLYKNYKGDHNNVLGRGN